MLMWALWCAGVNTLQYSNGYVSFKAQPDNVIPHTHNAAQCAQLCQRDASCVAWTRVAGELLCISPAFATISYPCGPMLQIPSLPDKHNM